MKGLELIPGAGTILTAAQAAKAGSLLFGARIENGFWAQIKSLVSLGEGRMAERLKEMAMKWL